MYDNELVVIFDDESTGAGESDTLLSMGLDFTPSVPVDSSHPRCGIRTRPRIMAWDHGRLVMRAPSLHR
jgi:hypothetical protein